MLFRTWEDYFIVDKAERLILWRQYENYRFDNIRSNYKIVGDSSVDACFSYDDSYIEKNGKPISISLPLEEKAFDEKRTRSFFEGLLPEGFTRKCVADWMQKDLNDYLSILAGLGNECLGAIQILDPLRFAKMLDSMICH